MNLDLCYIDLVCYPDTYFCIYLSNANWAQVHKDLFLRNLLLWRGT